MANTLKILTRDTQGALQYVTADAVLASSTTVAGKYLLNTAGVLSVNLPNRQPKTALATVGNGALTSAMMLSGLVMRTGPVGAYADTTDTAAQMVAAVPGAAVNDSFDFTIVNGVAFIDTFTAGAGVTLAGTTAIAASAIRSYRATFTNVTAGAEAVLITGIGAMTA